MQIPPGVVTHEAIDSAGVLKNRNDFFSENEWTCKFQQELKSSMRKRGMVFAVSVASIDCLGGVGKTFL